MRKLFNTIIAIVLLLYLYCFLFIKTEHGRLILAHFTGSIVIAILIYLVYFMCKKKLYEIIKNKNMTDAFTFLIIGNSLGTVGYCFYYFHNISPTLHAASSLIFDAKEICNAFGIIFIFNAILEWSNKNV